MENLPWIWGYEPVAALAIAFGIGLAASALVVNVVASFLLPLPHGKKRDVIVERVLHSLVFSAGAGEAGIIAVYAVAKIIS